MNHQRSIKLLLICMSICLTVLNLIGTASVDDTNNVCYWDWTAHFTNNIGEYSKAPPEFTYLIVDLYLKNEADKPISTNPYYWDFIADGIKYSPDSATFDNSINHQTVDVLKGG